MLWKGYFWLALALCIDISVCRTKLGPNNVGGKDSPEKDKKRQLKNDRILQSKATEDVYKPRKLPVDGSLASSILKKQNDKTGPAFNDNSQRKASIEQIMQSDVSTDDSSVDRRASGKSLASGILNKSSRTKKSDEHVKSTEAKSPVTTNKPKFRIFEDEDVEFPAVQTKFEKNDVGDALKQEQILQSEAAENGAKHRKLSVDGSLASNILQKQSVKSAESSAKSHSSEKSPASDLWSSFRTKKSDERDVQSTEAKSATTNNRPQFSILEDDESKSPAVEADVFVSSSSSTRSKVSRVSEKSTKPIIQKQKEERKASKSATVEAMRSIVEDDEEDEDDSELDQGSSGSGGGASSFNWSIGDIWVRALRQSRYEQEVEDINALHKVDDSMVRRLIVMPLTDTFKPHQADMMHGKIQYGDRCSLPASLGKLIFEKRYEVPWLFEVVPVRKINSKNAPDRLQQGILPVRNNSHLEGTNISQPLLDKAYMSPLDFRSPENYIFLPRWLMADLGLQPNDLVDISMIRIKLAELVVVQPVSLDWDTLIEQHGDPKSLLEHELSRYSSLTSKSTIAININGKEYPFYVKDTKAEGGVSVKGVRVQDADIRTDIDRSVLDKMIEAKKNKNAKNTSKPGSNV